jgi:preprotein translocase subunit SecB
MSDPVSADPAAATEPSASYHSGIQFTAVVVDRIAFSDLAPGEKKPDSLQFAFGIRRTSYKHPFAIEVSVSVRITPPAGVASRFSLEAEVTGRFQRSESATGMPLEEFAKTNAPALVMPYARELVTNITVRSRHGTIMFPPVNVFALVAQEAKRGEEQPTEP